MDCRYFSYDISANTYAEMSICRSNKFISDSSRSGMLCTGYSKCISGQTHLNDCVCFVCVVESFTFSSRVVQVVYKFVI